MTRLICNILGFQIAWWASVLSARAANEWLGIAVVLTVVAMHLAFHPQRKAELGCIALTAAIGYAADTVAALLGALQFPPHAVPALPAPLWVFGLWLAFATTLNTTFVWLRRRWLLAAGLGALSGPLSYAAGSALGVAIMPDATRSVIALAILWGATLPVLVFIAAQTAPSRRAASAAIRTTGAPA